MGPCMTSRSLRSPHRSALRIVLCVTRESKRVSQYALISALPVAWFWTETKMPRKTFCRLDYSYIFLWLLPVPWGTRKPPPKRKTLLDSPPLLVLLARGRRASGLDEGRTSPLEAGRVSDDYLLGRLGATSEKLLFRCFVLF